MLAYTRAAAAAPGTTLRDLRAPRRFAPRGSGRHSPSEGARPRAAAASPASGRRSMGGHHRRSWGRTSQERVGPLPPAGPTSAPRRPPPPADTHVTSRRRAGAAPAPPLRAARERRATPRSRMTSRHRRAGRRVRGPRVCGSGHTSRLAGAARPRGLGPTPELGEVGTLVSRRAGRDGIPETGSGTRCRHPRAVYSISLSCRLISG